MTYHNQLFKVHAVLRKDTKVLYAMKVLDKNHLVNVNMAKSVLNERKILAEIDYPLIVNLRCALQDTLDLYMIVDLMQGGDVRYHLKNKTFTEERSRLYFAQTALAINYLHTNGYIHRDIKPDNLLLDGEGNVHLTDFNLSLRIKKRGYTQFAGTKPYMAPEIYKKERYSKEVDWWSLGIMLYELIFGKLPYRGAHLKHDVVSKEVRFPDGADKKVVSLIKGLLQKDPKKRFSFQDIKDHKWMKGVDWVKLENKELPMPWVPEKNKAHCDGLYDLDEQFEVKKKRFPLKPEDEKLFEEWNWSPNMTKTQDDVNLSESDSESDTETDESDSSEEEDVSSDSTTSEKAPKRKKK